MELKKWYRKQPTVDKAIWIFIAFTVVYFGIGVIVGFSN